MLAPMQMHHRVEIYNRETSWLILFVFASQSHCLEQAVHCTQKSGSWCYLSPKSLVQSRSLHSKKMFRCKRQINLLFLVADTNLKRPQKSLGNG